MKKPVRQWLRIAFAVLLLFVLAAVPVLAADDRNSFSFWEPVADFFRWLFVPSGDYFVTKSAELSAHVNERLGGVAELYYILQDFFKALGGTSPTRVQAVLPKGFWVSGSLGVTVDVFEVIEPFVSLIRGVSTCFFLILTAVACYHHLRNFFKE